MTNRRLASIVLLTIALTLGGCGPSKPNGPQSTDTNSTTIPELVDRIDFLENYLSFKRQYDELEFHILYKNNGGGWVPGPSDWDIRLAAVVPPEELPLWTEGLDVSSEEANWLTNVNKQIDVSGVNTWFRSGGKVVVVDKENAVVVYRLNTFGF